VVVDDEGCRRSAGGRAEVVVDDEGCRRSAGGRAKVVVDKEGCRCSAGDSSTPVWSPSSSSSANGRAHLPASPRVSLAVVVVGGAISLGMAP